ncbi:MAG TPA: Smr/MutS family protein [Dehalococcoidia bacterium]|nr:Smr/MutS family protein [Dehalococcoidia bacterium]
MTLASPEPELDLHRLTVDEALPRVDQFLYESYVAGLPRVRVVHGKGTGTLRRVVRDYLPKHHLVKSFRPAEQGEGDGGVTIVELAE